jgi:hypothetical protein
MIQRRSEDYPAMQRGQPRFFYISISRYAPSLFGLLSLCLHLEVSRDLEKIYRKKIVKW